MLVRYLPMGLLVAGVSFVGVAYAQVIPIQPGMWEITARMTSMTGMPANMAGIMGRPQTIRNCVTPEQAKQGVQSVLKAESKGKCSYTKFNAAAGRFSHEMTCTGNGGLVMTASGTYTPSSYNSSSRMVMQGGKMVITGTASGRRVGPCKG